MAEYLLNDKRYHELNTELAYYEMDEEQIKYCIQTELNYFMPKIRQMEKDHWTLPWIIACIEDLYYDYLIYDSWYFYREMNKERKLTFKQTAIGHEIYMRNNDFNFYESNPLRH